MSILATSSISPLTLVGTSFTNLCKIFPLASLIVQYNDLSLGILLKFSFIGNLKGIPSLYVLNSFQVEPSRNSYPLKFQVILLSVALKIGADTLAQKTGRTPIPPALQFGFPTVGV